MYIHTTHYYTLTVRLRPCAQQIPNQPTSPDRRVREPFRFYMTICHMRICPYGPDRMILCPSAHMDRTV